MGVWYSAVTVPLLLFCFVHPFPRLAYGELGEYYNYYVFLLYCTHAEATSDAEASGIRRRLAIDARFAVGIRDFMDG